MLAKAHSFGLLGIDAYPVEIEVDVCAGLPNVSIVGLPDPAIKESKERVRSGIKNSGLTYPADKITINLAPADIKKEGPAFDLAIALGILAASGQVNRALLDGYRFVGELSLNGELRAIKGVLPMALALRKKSAGKIVVPFVNAKEASVVKGIEVFGIKTLAEAVALLGDRQSFKPHPCPLPSIGQQDLFQDIDFSDVKGQWAAKRAIEIAASGRHNILLIGPPGAGKTMLAKRLNTILPAFTEEEALETTRIHSAMGLSDPQTGLLTQRPFRAPHHTISGTALVGGGSSLPQPGEISLAHNGVLFLDELPEFHRDALEALRQPLEDGHIRVSRSARSLAFPSRFMLICAMNPCPCGYAGDLQKTCRCTPPKVQNYLNKVSGPLLDRIDIHMEIPAVKYKELAETEQAEPSCDIKARVEKARAIQRKRFSAEGISSNSQMNTRLTRKFCVLEASARELLKMAMTELGLTARGYDKVLKVSRTIADLAESDGIRAEHVAEALQYRRMEEPRKLPYL